MCSLDLSSVKDFECINKCLFDEGTVDSPNLVFVPMQNRHEACVIFFIYFDKRNNIMILYRLNLVETINDFMLFSLSNFKVKTFNELAKDVGIKAFSFLDEISSEVVTVFMTYTLKGKVWIMRMKNDSFFNPMFLDFTNKDIFINTKHIMVLDYETRSMRFIGLLENYLFDRKIWPDIKIKSISQFDTIFFVDDFILAEHKDSPFRYVSIILNHGNPYINKVSMLRLSVNVIPKYIQTSRMSMVLLGFKSRNEFVCLLKSFVVQYKLEFSDHRVQLKKNQKIKRLFAFYLLFKTYYDDTFTKKIEVNLSDDYQITSKLSFLDIAKFNNWQKIDLSKYFNGNIYAFKFMVEDLHDHELTFPTYS